MARPDTLLMLSGGLDSALCLWERVKAGQTTRVHHVSLTNSEGRARFEDRAVSRILTYMRERGGKIWYTESSVDYRTLHHRPLDHHLWAYWIGVILANEPELTTVVKPAHWDSFRDGPDCPQSRRAREHYNVGVKIIANRLPVWETPLQQMMKAEIVAAIPDDLAALCWYCRTPVKGKPCHNCYTCELVDAAGSP